MRGAMKLGLTLVLTLAMAGCEALATGITAGEDASTSSASAANSEAPFQNWHQGFQHGTAGWSDLTTGPDGGPAADDSPFGWCGDITRRARGDGDQQPSSGSAYATVALGPCNAFWSSPPFGIPASGPYAPGPELALLSETWPTGGYVTELDVYLDPTWSQRYAGPVFGPADYSTTIADLAVSVRVATGGEPGLFDPFVYYFAPVRAVEGEEVLSILGHEVREAGWYRFRFVFGDDGGAIRADFELADRRGRTLVSVADLPAEKLTGPFKVDVEDYVPPEGFPPLPPLATSNYGSGHTWFFIVAPGLELPIDEHRVRRGS